MPTEKPEPIKAKIYEDKTYVINAPYTSSLGKELFNDKRFNIKIWKENGDDVCYVWVREKEQ